MHRLYLLPVDEQEIDGKIYRGPEYLDWTYGTVEPGLETVRWAMIDYGDHDTMLAHCILDATQHSILAGQTNVLTVPENIDNNLTSGAVTQTKDYLSSNKIPSVWVTTSYTYRTVLRVVIGMFFFVQRIGSKMATKRFLDVYPLNTELGDIPASKRDKISATADSFGIDYSSLTGTSTLRDFLKLAGQHWKNTPINHGGYHI